MKKALLCGSALRLVQLVVHRPRAAAPGVIIKAITIAVVAWFVACRVISGRE